MGIPEIQAAIALLPGHELAELMTWLEAHQALIWDKQIEADLEAGRLDDLLAEVDDEFESGLGRPLS